MSELVHDDWRIQAGDHTVMVNPERNMSFAVPGCRGSAGYVALRDGMAVSWFDVVSDHPCSVETGTERSELVCVLPLLGQGEMQFIHGGGRITLKSEEPVFTVAPVARNVIGCPEGGRVFLAQCQFDTALWARHFDSEPRKDLRFQRAMSGLRNPPFALRLAGVPRLLGIARELLRHPYNGAAANLFMESRLLELIAHILAALDASNGAPRYPSWRRSELDCLEDARQRLLVRMADPPSLQSLAHSVGLNRNRLVQGFRTHFGAAPFEWLRAARMDHACALLRAGNANIAELAADCGYAHVSTFSAAFKTRFGLAPQQWRRANR